MLKIIGMILMVSAGIGYGYEKSMELTRREKTLETLHRMIILLKGEIRCGNASLADAFCEIGEKFTGEYQSFLKETAKEMQCMKGESFDVIFRRCAEQMLMYHKISEEEKECFVSLGERLGYLDREMQLRQLELYENELIRCIEGLRVVIPEKRKVYRSLGVLGGILLAVLVW